MHGTRRSFVCKVATTSSSWSTWLFQGWHIHIRRQRLRLFRSKRYSVSNLFRASLRRLNNDYEPCKLSRLLRGCRAGAAEPPDCRFRLSGLLHVSVSKRRLVGGSTLHHHLQGFVRNVSLRVSSPNGRLQTFGIPQQRDDSCRVKLLRGICMCLPR